jgi:hypothetical protein
MSTNRTTSSIGAFDAKTKLSELAQAVLSALKSQKAIVPAI